jgi:hypothetical protein
MNPDPVSPREREALCRELLPGGRKVGGYWRVGSLLGEPGNKFAVNLLTGAFGFVADDSQSGSGDVELWAAVTGIDLQSAETQLAAWRAAWRQSHGESVSEKKTEKPEEITQNIPSSTAAGEANNHSFADTSEDERPMTMYYVDEYERATTSLLWHHPEFLPLIRRELDLELHVANPVYRTVIEAIALVYGVMGDADWPCAYTRSLR